MQFLFAVAVGVLWVSGGVFIVFNLAQEFSDIAAVSDDEQYCDHAEHDGDW
ncbi:MAG: hypothetical protein HRU15_17285 [Planctomycetes bacterium]|nr:hypothetical protein [Planctomycetota bacterium]